MSTCCPNCSSAAVGTDLASACTECMSVSLAGGSMSMAMLAGIIGGVFAVGFIARRVSGLLSGRVALLRA